MIKQKKTKIGFIYTGLIFSLSFFLAGNTLAFSFDLNVISRTEWGADENWRFCRNYDASKRECVSYDFSEATWPLEYQPIKKIVLHETHGVPAGDNPNEILRNLYLYHSLQLDWGDVGYNYLIDEKGNIYEGRFGGDGVVAGHTFYTYNDKETGAKIGYNLNFGSIGIGILGKYQDISPTMAAGEAINKLILAKALDFGFNPRGEDGWPVLVRKFDEVPEMSESDFLALLERSAAMLRAKGIRYHFDLSNPDRPYVVLENVPNIVTHRDIDYTYDPPESLYQVVSNARYLASENWRAFMAQGLKQGAIKLSQSASEVYLKPGETKEVWAEFRNDGETTWHNYTEDKVYLADSAVKSRLAMLGGVRYALSQEPRNKNQEPNNNEGEMEKANVAPGEAGRFRLKITAPQAGLAETQSYVLAVKDKGWFPQTDVSFKVYAQALDYAAQFVSQSIPEKIAPGAKQEISFQFKNLGAKTWQKNDLTLMILDSLKWPSVFGTEDWPEPEGNFTMAEQEVSPGQTATFSFSIQAPEELGIYPYLVELYQITQIGSVTQAKLVSGASQGVIFKVTSPLSAQISSIYLPPAVLKAWRPKVSLMLKNDGSAAWEKGTKLKLVGENSNLFWYKSWAGRSVIAELDTEIASGGQATFSFQITPPSKGLQRLNFVLETPQGKKIFISEKETFERLLRVD